MYADDTAQVGVGGWGGSEGVYGCGCAERGVQGFVPRRLAHPAHPALGRLPPRRARCWSRRAWLRSSSAPPSCWPPCTASTRSFSSSRCCLFWVAWFTGLVLCLLPSLPPPPAQPPALPCATPPPLLQAEGGPGCEAAVKAREKALLPVYHQVAVQFAQVRGVCGWGRRTGRGGAVRRLGTAALRSCGCRTPRLVSPPPAPHGAADARRPRAHAGQGHAACHRAVAPDSRLLRGPPAPPADGGGASEAHCMWVGAWPRDWAATAYIPMLQVPPTCTCC